MSTIRSSAIILISILASAPGHLVTAQDAWQFADGHAHPANLTSGSAFLTDGFDESVQLLVSDIEDPLSTSQMASQECGYDTCNYPFFLNEPCPRVYFQTQALLFQQVPQFGRQPIVIDNIDNSTLLSTSDLKPNFKPGVQATLGWQLHSGRAVELDYMGLFGGTTSAVAVKPDPASFLTFPNNFAGNVFVDMDRLQADYTSSFHSFAINLLSGCNTDCCTSCDELGCDGIRCGGARQSLSWFGGFRYINFSDRINLSAQRTVGGLPENGTYNTSTDNNLYGAQLGAKLRRTSGRFGWDASGFAGIFGNDASQTQSVTDFPNFPIRPTVSSQEGGVAFVGGGNLSGLYSLNQAWNLKAGYSALWIDGLALAPDQLDFDLASAQGGSALNNGGGLLLHGVNVGLEARW